VAVLGRLHHSCGCYFIALLSLGSCSVFPDHAELVATSGSGGAEATAGSSAAGGSGSSGPANGANGAGAANAGGGKGKGGKPNSAGPDAAGDGGVGGGAGVAAMGDCSGLREVTQKIEFDTWIDFAQPRSGFADDPRLLVCGVPDEQRALLQVVLPASAQAVAQATLQLHLEANADVTQSVRLLGLHQLTQQVSSKTTWLNYSTRKWDTEGGDFGPELARATLPASTSESTLTFDVTELVRGLSGSTAVTLPLVVLEIDAAPPAPAQLAFTSNEGDATQAPTLLLSYCEP
jgi:hypothetical protein